MPPTVSAVTHGLAAALRIRRSHRCERRHFSRHLAPPFLSSSSITRTRRCHAPRAATLGRHTAVQGARGITTRNRHAPLYFPPWKNHSASARRRLPKSGKRECARACAGHPGPTPPANFPAGGVPAGAARASARRAGTLTSGCGSARPPPHLCCHSPRSRAS